MKSSASASTTCERYLTQIISFGKQICANRSSGLEKPAAPPKISDGGGTACPEGRQQRAHIPRLADASAGLLACLCCPCRGAARFAPDDQLKHCRPLHWPARAMPDPKNTQFCTASKLMSTCSDAPLLRQHVPRRQLAACAARAGGNSLASHGVRQDYSLT